MIRYMIYALPNPKAAGLIQIQTSVNLVGKARAKSGNLSLEIDESCHEASLMQNKSFR